jgi:hypothetical protein
MAPAQPERARPPSGGAPAYGDGKESDGEPVITRIALEGWMPERE